MASSHLKLKTNPKSSPANRPQRPNRPKPVSKRSTVTSSKLPLENRKSARSQSPPLKKKNKPLPLPKLRMLAVWGILTAGMLGLGYKLYHLQVIQAAWLQKKAQAQQTTSLQPYIPRRAVIDNLGNVLATDRLMYVLYVHPKLFKKPKEEIAQELALILGNRTPQELVQRFNQQASGIKLATRLSESQAAKIHSLELDGLELEQQYARFYPQEEMAADVVGYVDGDHHGQAGIELSQKQLLERDALSFSIRRAGNGTILPAFLPQDLLQSNDWQLQLTLDMRLQRAAKEALQAQMKVYKAKRGTVLIMDAKDGAILAMVNEPSFNPNEYYKSKVEYFKNWSVSDLYEPGSTFKPINVALAMSVKAITPETRVFDGGSVRVGPWTIKNSHHGGGGLIDVAQIIKTSSNVGMVGLMRHLSPDQYYTLLQGVGMSSKTGIDLPGEVANYLKTREEFVSQPIEPATAAFGQGLSLTPIKLLQLNAALANGGRLVTPHVVEGLVDGRGTLHWQPDYPVKTVFSQPDAHAIVRMMGDVVNADGGTGKAAQINGYDIGGKTGTAQKAGPRGGYLANTYITSFVSILPVEDPRYVVLAVVDEPKGGNVFGGTVAAPVVKKVMEALIAIKEIPPSSPTAIDPLKPLTDASPDPQKKNH